MTTDDRETIYALPAEPCGPVWDEDGGRWDLSPVHGLWCGPDGLRRTWGELLCRHGSLTTASPRKPEVGGVCKTTEQYAAMPEGSIVARANAGPFIKLADGRWHGESGPWTDVNMAALTSPVLRVGWES